MQLKNKLFSYPVMSDDRDDYKKITFKTDVNVKNNINTLEFNLSYSLENRELLELYEKNKIDIIFHIECSKSSYREIVIMKNSSNKKVIDAKKIIGKTIVSSYIVAKEDLLDFKNDDFDDDYQGYSFNINKGNVLSIGEIFIVNVEPHTDMLGNSESIFSITRRDIDKEKGMQIEIVQNKIAISLDTDTFDNYKALSLNRNFIPILHSSLILPALVFTLETLNREDKSDYEDFKWYKSINNKLALSNIELSDNINTFEVAQKILDMPIYKAFDSLVKFDTEEDD